MKRRAPQTTSEINDLSADIRRRAIISHDSKPKNPFTSDDPTRKDCTSTLLT